jgi:Carboxypeptidase regulatory-like domain
MTAAVVFALVQTLVAGGPEGPPLRALMQTPSASVDGVVMKAGTDEPVPHARLQLQNLDGGLGDIRVVDADDRGRFAFAAVAPGRYRVTGQKDDFVRAATAAFSVEGGQAIRGLTVMMTPTGIIVGRVVDEFGDPVARVYVRASTAESSYETQTDDLGEYRLFDLPAGSYVMSAVQYRAPRIEKGTLITPTPAGPYSPGEGQGMMPVSRLLQAGDFINPMALRGDVYATTFYPATTDRAAAVPIVLAPGALILGIDFTTAVTRFP